MSNPARVIVLVEDQRQRNFVQRYLERLGYSYREIRFEVSPTGKGSAEQWVREQYPKQVRAYRSRAARVQIALIIVIDADMNDVEYRQQQFRDALTQVGLAARPAGRELFTWFPKEILRLGFYA